VFVPPSACVVDGQLEESAPVSTSADGYQDVMVALPPLEGQCSQREFTPVQQAIVEHTVELAMRLFPEIANNDHLRSAMCSLAGEAFRLEDEAYTTADAEA
jgi:hypothetical protein